MDRIRGDYPRLQFCLWCREECEKPKQIWYNGAEAIVKVQAKDRMALCDSEVRGINRNGWPQGRLIKRRILWVAGTYEDQEKERERPGWYPGSEMSR